MKVCNVPNLIPAGTVMNTTINSSPQQLYDTFIAAIQVIWTGTPNGTFVLEASNDPVFSGQPGWPQNWVIIPESSYAVTAAGNYMWNLIQPGYNYVRVNYTDSSGGTSTATITYSTVNIKGF